jgi:hypothetical protein
MTAISKAIPLYDPRTGEQDKQVVPPSPEEVAEAARALREGQTAWRALGLEGRIASMRRWADAIEAAAERPAHLRGPHADDRDRGVPQSALNEGPGSHARLHYKEGLRTL